MRTRIVLGPVLATVLATVLTAFLAAGCAGQQPASTPPAGPTAAVPTTAPRTDEDAIRSVYDSYGKALLARDFAAACGLLTDTSAAAVVATIAKSAGPKVTSCADAFGLVYSSPQAAGILDPVVRSIAIQVIAVQGDAATVTYTRTENGTPSAPLKAGLRRIAGRWMIDKAL